MKAAVYALQLALTGASALITHCSRAQNWQTADEFQYSPGKAAYPRGLAKDPTGTIIYAAGNAQDAGGLWHAVAFKSSDGGVTWLTIDDYFNPAAPSNSGPGYDA